MRVLMPMTKKQKVALLRDVALFSGISPRQLSAIADLITEIDVEPGRHIVRQGQVGTGFYLIASGRANVVLDGKTLAILGPGEFFGELSLLDQQPRMAHVIAAERTTCLALASWDFTRLLEKTPKLTLGILREVAKRLREVSAQHQH